MRAVGIICEYNPFHRGHLLHIGKALKLSGADAAVCVMSGAAVQRGSFARHDKWTRAEAALRAGASLVLELPVRFACASAPDFARGGVSLLSALGAVDSLSFGCEPEMLPYLEPVADLLRREPSAFSQALRENLSAGLSFPAARAAAAETVSGCSGLSALLENPNACLALEYLKVLPENIRPVPVAREGAGYNSTELSSLSSASAIRNALENGRTEDALAELPFPARFASAETDGFFHVPESLDTLLLWKLRSSPAEQLSRIFGVREGLENRILAAAKTAGTAEELLSLVKTRRYTRTHLSRIFTHILLGLTQETADEYAEPAYARILGFRRSAVPLLSQIKRCGSIPLISRPSDLSHPILDLDIAAQDLWSLGCRNPALRRSGRDHITPPVILEDV